MNFLKLYSPEALRGDLFGGVTAAVVGLPVALAFGVASGLGPLPGLYGSIAVGLFAAVFGGTRGQISGPTGPMSVAMAVVVTLYADDLPKAFTIVVMAGLIQILLGALRIGRFISYTPYSVHLRVHVRHRRNRHAGSRVALPGPRGGHRRAFGRPG